MIWSLQLRILCQKTAAITLHNETHTSAVLFSRGGTSPGSRRWKKDLLQSESEYYEKLKNECELGADFDLIKPEVAYDSQVWEQKKHNIRVQQIMTAKKFFASRPQPPMLTWNERQCIKYLHKEDPVLWNIKSLSESFPATPETIKKIISSKIRISPERAKLLDLKVQKNWELLAEGKLDADPHVLEHLKKFINRRDILLDQINKTDFYLPEVKAEPVWNQGEMNKILMDYDKALNKLAAETQQNEDVKVLSDFVSNKKNMNKEGKSNLDLIYEKIKIKSRNEPELKDSFIFGKMINAFKESVTLEDLENKILRKSDKKEKLELFEKAVLDRKLKVNSSENYRIINKSNNHKENRSNPKSAEKESGLYTSNLKKSLKLESKISIEYDKLTCDRIKAANPKPDQIISFENKSQDSGIGEPLKKNLSLEETKFTVEKPEIDFSDPVRLQNEKVYYDQQVSDIKNTAFWNNKRGSQEKAMAEFSKQPIKVPAYCDQKADISNTSALSTDSYPERIKIPKNKQGSGLTFRIKDCYYDDDGEFLYRVPGMTK